MIRISFIVLGALCTLSLCHDVEGVYDILHEAYPSSEWLSGRAKPVEPVARGRKNIIDITHEMRPDLPAFGVPAPVGIVAKRVQSMEDGLDYNLSELKLIVHTGTHLDAPGHYVNEMYDAGYDVNGLDLDILIGPALLVDTPRDSNITAKVLESLDIPVGVQRILFRTANTDKRLMWNKEFDSSFIGFTEDGADWLVTHRPDVKLIGLDYLSVAIINQLKGVHRIFLLQTFPDLWSQADSRTSWLMQVVLAISEDHSGGSTRFGGSAFRFVRSLLSASAADNGGRVSSEMRLDVGTNLSQSAIAHEEFRLQ